MYILNIFLYSIFFFSVKNITKNRDLGDDLK